ncbi:Propionate kinase [Edwardsiella tarda]|nr:Propionate kinase [Edwardsiella tarda]
MHEFPVVLVINSGSSSIKFSVLDATSCELLLAGIAEGINGGNARLSVNGGEAVKLTQQGYEPALAAIVVELEKRNLSDSVSLIGHRVAHGGNLFKQSVIINESVMAQIRQIAPWLRCITTPI